MAMGKKYRSARSAVNKKVFGSNTNALRQKLKAKRTVKRAVARGRSKGIGLIGKAINRATGSTGGVYKFTAARKAALAKAREASARARARGANISRRVRSLGGRRDITRQGRGGM